MSCRVDESTRTTESTALLLELSETGANAETRNHPFLSGNFAAVDRASPLTACGYDGDIPDELLGGQYVRNGANPLYHEDLTVDAHWFDGDGMLTGVSFRRVDEGSSRVRPEFVNQFILTDVYLSSVTTPSLRKPILISIATLLNPLSGLLRVGFALLRTFLLVFLSHLWGSRQAITRSSVANTAVYYHDGRALATCESGPPMRVALPGLETVGWYDGRTVEGEGPTPGDDRGGVERPGFGGTGAFSQFREWATGHPRIDPVTDELIIYHSTVVPPYVRYSVVPGAARGKAAAAPPPPTPLLGATVPGIKTAKMMHDFAVSSGHTVIMDLPLTLDPMNLLRGRSVVSYDPNEPTRFGVFPRMQPERVRWFETRACCIFHSANTWDELVPDKTDAAWPVAVNMLVCRLNTAALVFTAANVETPASAIDRSRAEGEVDQCRLYYYRFDLRSVGNAITHQWALSAISMEFPSVRDDRAMGPARYVFGCSSSSGFTATLGRTDKVDAIVKIDSLALIARGTSDPPTPVTGCVDSRGLDEVLRSTDPDDPIRVFRMPAGWFGQEPRFVPRRDGAGEDDGWLLFYAYDESQLDEEGMAPDSSRSELWIVDAKDMRDIVARVHLPQRVPYGLHGNWFTERQILRQRSIQSVRSIPPQDSYSRGEGRLASSVMAAWMPVRNALLRCLG